MASPRPALRSAAALIALVLLLGTGLAALAYWLLKNLLRLSVWQLLALMLPD
ncbi:hypothetical protein AB0K60_25675 [Thermopolyspora sp. NPDC052614]|uniref:hypothetical protein n=1 Tax=Thermopolyspora sp. NPDC052614 TaxID=3155682 RepID=UPI003431619F